MLRAKFKKHTGHHSLATQFSRGHLVNSADTGRLKAIKDHFYLVATVARVSAEAEDVNARKKQRKEKGAVECERKKAASAEIEEILPLNSVETILQTGQKKLNVLNTLRR